MDVRDQRDGEVVLGELSIEGLAVVDVEGDGVGVGDAGAEALCALEGAAGCEC